MSEAPEVNPTPAKTPEAHPLDAVTGGAFSAETSGDRAARLRDWLATSPAHDVLQEVFKEMNARDKGAARVVRERLDELRRAKDQDAPWAKQLVAAYQSEPVRQFILQKYQGSVIPAF